jgi:membrane protease YdiL (CAAX protease family)
MNVSSLVTPANGFAALLALAPYLAVAFFPERMAAGVRLLPLWTRLCAPALLCLAYVVVSSAAGNFRWAWLGLYAGLPVGVAVMLWWARRSPAAERGTWQDFLVLAVLGLAVDLRWFEAAWPAHLAVFSKILLMDAGIYGFLMVRELDGVGFDLRLRWRDAAVGLRETAFYTPFALVLGLSMGFLHAHAVLPGVGAVVGAWLFTFFFIAVPEELFFRGWLQNLLERRMGRWGSLLATSVLFGLAHFNKRAANFNWRYVLMAAIAGFFYGRAWLSARRVGTSAVTHASVDAIWSLWLQ